MNENELRERYIRRAFQYESVIDALLTKGLVDMEAASATKERFYDTLNEERLLATQKIRDYHESIGLYMRTLAQDGMLTRKLRRIFGCGSTRKSGWRFCDCTRDD